MVDFALPPKASSIRLVAGKGHYHVVIKAVLEAECSVWIATANLKDMMIKGNALGDAAYLSILEVLSDLATRGCELRILHGSMPSRAFRDSFDRLPRLTGGGLELRLCPRVHFKTVIVDGELMYLGSANWTGAGLGIKAEDRRNFEMGIVTEDPDLLDHVQGYYDRIWHGKECPACQRRALCEAPLDL